MSQEYSVEAQAALQELYDNAASRVSEALTPKMKILVLDNALGGPSNFYASGGILTVELKLKCLELQYLEMRGLVQMELA